MLLIKILCVGKLKDSFFREAVAEYEKRMKTLCKLEIIEVPEERLPENPSESQIEKALQKEGERLLAKASGKIIPLCIEGRQIDSQGLADLLSSVMQLPGSVSFVIGSSFGLSNEVKAKGQGISMSRMTFPHTLARVMLVEQVYRGLQILGGGKYHK